MRLVLTVALLFAPPTIWSCTCLGTASIHETVVRSPFLIEAKLVSFEQVDIPKLGKLTRSATLNVAKVLKGSIASNTVTVEGSMCYASMFLEDMKPGHVYVLPLTRRTDGRYALADCAHSGLELVDGKLYTFEETAGARKRMQFYMSYSDFVSMHER